MHSITFLATALLPTLGLATRYLASPNTKSGASLMSTGDGNAGHADGANECGISSFTKLTVGDPPLVKDCKQMAANIQGDQDYEVFTQGTELTSYGTCAFSAVVIPGDNQDTTTFVGNADIIDLTLDSIRMFEEGGTIGCHGNFNLVVAASGTVPCDDADTKNGVKVRVDWSLVHSSGSSDGSSDGSNGQSWDWGRLQGGTSGRSAGSRSFRA